MTNVLTIAVILTLILLGINIFLIIWILKKGCCKKSVEHLLQGEKGFTSRLGIQQLDIPYLYPTLGIQQIMRKRRGFGEEPERQIILG